MYFNNGILIYSYNINKTFIYISINLNSCPLIPFIYPSNSSFITYLVNVMSNILALCPCHSLRQCPLNISHCLITPSK